MELPGLGVGRCVGIGDKPQFGTDFLFGNSCKWINQGHRERDRTPVKGKGKGGGVEVERKPGSKLKGGLRTRRAREAQRPAKSFMG